MMFILTTFEYDKVWEYIIICSEGEQVIERHLDIMATAIPIEPSGIRTNTSSSGFCISMHFIYIILLEKNAYSSIFLIGGKVNEVRENTKRTEREALYSNIGLFWISLQFVSSGCDGMDRRKWWWNQGQMKWPKCGFYSCYLSSLRLSFCIVNWDNNTSPEYSTRFFYREQVKKSL